MNLNSIIEKLKEITDFGGRVYPKWPPTFSIYPILSVRYGSKKEEVLGDDKGQVVFSNIITIDLWAQAYEIENLSNKVIEKMYSLTEFVYLQNLVPVEEGEIQRYSLDFLCI